MNLSRILCVSGGVALLAACSPPPASKSDGAKPAAPTSTGAQASGAPAAVPAGQNVDQAVFASPALKLENRSPDILKAQILLDRARFSPGEIDGSMGENVKNALTAFQTANGLQATGEVDQPTLQKLSQVSSAPLMQAYTITPQDVAGPFFTIPKPDDIKAQSELPAMGYNNIREALAERFHMSEELLAALNPGVDLTKAGSVINVAAVNATKLPTEVATIEVDKQARVVRALDKDDHLIAAFPATIGSTDRPAPSGVFKVNGVSWNPTYTFDPKRLTFGHKGVHSKVVVKPGPNNPVGLVWIDLSKDTYGIHGTPEPKQVGKTASHGCVRLTNWDIQQLASGVKGGAKVSFISKTSQSEMAKAGGMDGSDAAPSDAAT